MSDLIRREDAYAAIRGLTRHIDRIAAITALPAVQPHVNETPKSEHESADMLKLSVQGQAREAALHEAAAACIWDDGDASRAAILALIDKPKGD